MTTICLLELHDRHQIIDKKIRSHSRFPDPTIREASRILSQYPKLLQLPLLLSKYYQNHSSKNTNDVTDFNYNPRQAAVLPQRTI